MLGSINFVLGTHASLHIMGVSQIVRVAHSASPQAWQCGCRETKARCELLELVDA